MIFIIGIKIKKKNKIGLMMYAIIVIMEIKKHSVVGCHEKTGTKL